MANDIKAKYILSLFDVMYIIIGLPWLFLMLFTSRSLTAVKTGMLILLVLVCLTEIIFKKINCNAKQFGYVVLFAFFALFEILIGILNGYSFNAWGSEFPLLQYFIATPIFAFIISTAIRAKQKRRECLWTILKYMTLALTVLDLLRIVLVMIGVTPWFLEFIPIANINTDELVMRVSNEPSLMFLLPVFIYVLVNPHNDSKKDRLIYMVIVATGIIYSLMSGRKILELLVALSFLVSFIFNNGRLKFSNLLSSSMIRAYFVIFVILVALYYILELISKQVGVDNIFSVAMDTLINGLSADNDGTEKRLGNTDALLALWSESPFWGNGLQSYARNSIASSDTRWSYEVFYVAWLAQTGIIGCILLFIPIRYIVRKLRRAGLIFKDNRYYAIMIGFICFMISGASNPMLYLIWPWTIALIYCINIPPKTKHF